MAELSDEDVDRIADAVVRKLLTPTAAPAVPAPQVQPWQPYTQPYPYPWPLQVWCHV